MKQRVITAIIGLILLVAVVFFYETLLFNVVMALVSLIAAYELLNATGLIKYRFTGVIAAGFSLILPFALIPKINQHIIVIIFVLSILFFVFVIYDHSRLKFEQMTMAMLISIFIPLFFSTAVYMRDEFGYTKGLYFLLLALGSAWLSDSGAYFTGYFLGKTPMAPHISPKKTIEGGVGGVITATILNVALAHLFSWFMLSKQGLPIEINYLAVGLASPFLALIGMLGDLVASVIKRQYSIKDYGHIMPGHGGIMDRFDSVLLTLPSVYVLVKTIEIAI